jgi:hypothetical protein
VIALVVGRRRQGKSTLALYIALTLGDGRRGVVVFDPSSQYGGYQVTDVSQLADDLAEGRERIIVYRPDIDDVDEEFNAVADELLHWQRFTFLVDESWQFQTALTPNKRLERWVRTAPIERVHLVQTLHRPRDASTIVRSVATDWYLFRQTNPIDLKVIEEYAGPDVAEHVAGLGRHHYVHYNSDEQTYRVYDEPESWYVDIENPAEVSRASA